MTTLACLFLFLGIANAVVVRSSGSSPVTRLRKPIEGFDYRARSKIREFVASNAGEAVVMQLAREHGAALRTTSVDAMNVASSSSSSSSSISSTPAFQFFTQQVDHTDMGKTFQQRFVEYDFSAGAEDHPVFFYLGGEGPLEMFLSEVYAIQLAKESGAKLYFLEHRFYGKSIPLGDMSTESLKDKLSVGQALLDMATFADTYGNSDASKNVMFGCSYSGCLSGWYRAIFPQSVGCAYAPSGPVLAQTNFTGYLGQFATTGGPSCADAVAWATTAVYNAPRSTLESLFKVCPASDIADKDWEYFQWTVAVTIAGEAQEDLPPNFPVRGICDTLISAKAGGQDPVKTLAEVFNSLADPGSSPGACNDFTESKMIDSLKSSSPEDNYDGTRAWYYQKCTEFGYWKSAYGTATSPFNFNVPVERLVGYCSKIFGVPNMTPNTYEINEMYGAKDPAVTNVLVTQGSLDPWHLLGITPPVKPAGVKSVMYAAGHCAPLHADTNADPQSLIAARKDIKDFISTCIGGTN